MLLNCGIGEDSWESIGLWEIQPVHPKGNQFWIFIVRTDTEAETPILWWPDAKNWLIWKDPDAGKDWRQEERRTTEDEMVGWHHLQWTWVWAGSGCWWQTGKPGVSQYMGSQRVGHDWAELKAHWKWLEERGGLLSRAASGGTQMQGAQQTPISPSFRNPPSLAFSTLWVFSYLISVSPPALPHTHTPSSV